MATKRKNKKKNGSLLTLACSLLALLVVLVVFLTQKNTIFTNLKETSFFDRAFGTTPEFVKNHQVEKKEPKSETVEIKDSTVTIKIENEKIEIPEEKLAEPKEDVKPAKESEKVEEKKTETKTDTKKESKPEVKKPATTQLQLCFVVIDGDGSVTRKMVKRSVSKNNSPLTAAINELLKGPSVSVAAEKNCMSLIPKGTKLLSAKVTDGVAYLNFNDSFDINPYGVEGYVNQLMQVVYTATSFSTVNSVQFLIEGEKREYLGSEGQWIGSPLSRGSF